MPVGLLRRGLLAGTCLLSGAPACAADVADEPGTIVVTGTMPSGQASSGTKTTTPLIETPQSISVISSADLAGLGLQNLNQALRYVAGVTPEQRGASAEVYDQFKLRGFDAPVYLDGLKLFASASGYAVPQVDISRLDRIEVIKGPASVLYGQSSPGGLVAETSKLPLDSAFYAAVAGTYGNYDLYRVDGDVGGRVSEGVLWRLYGSVNGAHSQQTYGVRRRQTVSGAVTVGAGTPTSLTLLGAYSRDPRNGDYGVFPALGTLIANPAGRIRTSFYGGEPDDFFKRDQTGLSAFLRHDLGGGWTLKSSARYQHIRSRLGIVYTGGAPADPLAPAPTLFTRYSYATREHNNGWTYDNQLTGVVHTGPLTHTLLFGADRQVAHSAELYAFGGGTPIDVFDPIYGTMPTPQTPYDVPGYAAGTLATPAFVATRQRQQGLYAQDQIALEGLRLTVSGRKDWARQASAGAVQHDDKWTYRVGGLYLLPFGLAPYASYSTSFEPQAAQLAGGGFAKPSLGKQVEAGVKYQVPGTGIIATAAWFRIEQTNVAVYDPLTFLAYQVGKVRSRGVEVEVDAPLPHDFKAHVAFSRQRVKQVEDVNPANVGRGLATAGRGGTSATLEWSPKAGLGAGATIGAGVRHVDRVYADIYFDGVARYSPSYTLVDALARYEVGKAVPRLDGLTIGIDAKNILDRKYLTSCYSNYGWCWYGNRRTIQGTIGYRW